MDSVLCAGAQNIGMLLAGRVIQGLGAGGQMGLVLLPRAEFRVVWADISTFLVRVLLLSRACSELAVVITMLA